MISFKLLAIRPLQGCSSKYRKNLRAGCIYKFYRNYLFNDDNGQEVCVENNNLNGKVGDAIRHESEFDLFSIDENLKVSISSIVGKNGSGKSSLLELFFLAIYLCNYKSILTHKKKVEHLSLNIEERHSFNQIIEQIKGHPSIGIGKQEAEVLLGLVGFKSNRVALEVYYEHDANIYKVIVDTDQQDDEDWFVVERQERNGRFMLDKTVKPFPFYTIALNYSIHSLDSSEMGSWLDDIFHKNDGYQTPLVINPKRDEGSIDVSNEKDLQKSRLLINTMDIISSSFTADPLFNGRSIKKIVFKFPLENRKGLISNITRSKTDKFFNLNPSLNALNEDEQTKIELISEVFALKGYDQCSWIEREAYGYIMYKVRRIIKNYSNLFPQGDSDDNYRKNLEIMAGLKSHITYKLKQTINFIALDNYIKKEMERYKPESIDNLYAIGSKGYGFDLYADLVVNINNTGTNIVDQIYSSNDTIETIGKINFLPPPIFDYNIYFSDDADDTFENLSSGEKQQLYSIHTVMYHIRNLSSVNTATGYNKFKEVNIMLDEIELYFHPEMQRQFIKRLLLSFEQMKKYLNENITSINVLLATHSPFILSDISADNVLHLIDGRPVYSNDKTFGANIHDLLANDFFLENGFMGEFAKEKINEVIDSMQIQSVLNRAQEAGEKLDSDKAKLKYLKRSFDRYKTLEKIDIKGQGYCKQLIEIVGEPMLYMSLMELYKQTYSNSANNFIDEQIKKLEAMKKA